MEDQRAETAKVYTLDSFRGTTGVESTSIPEFIKGERPASNITTEKATPLGLYSHPGAVSSVISIIEKISSCTSHIDDALMNFEDEIERGIQVDYLANSMQELIYLKEANSNFGDILTAINICLWNKITVEPIKREDLVTLRSVFEIIKNNFTMSASVYDRCFKILNDHFDFAIPMSVDLNE